MYQSLSFNKVAGIKKEILAEVFSYEFCEIFENTYFYRTPPDDCFCNPMVPLPFFWCSVIILGDIIIRK